MTKGDAGAGLSALALARELVNPGTHEAIAADLGRGEQFGDFSETFADAVVDLTRKALGDTSESAGKAIKSQSAVSLRRRKDLAQRVVDAAIAQSQLGKQEAEARSREFKNRRDGEMGLGGKGAKPACVELTAKIADISEKANQTELDRQLKER